MRERRGHWWRRVHAGRLRQASRPPLPLQLAAAARRRQALPGRRAEVGTAACTAQRCTACMLDLPGHSPQVIWAVLSQEVVRAPFQ